MAPALATGRAMAGAIVVRDVEATDEAIAEQKRLYAGVAAMADNQLTAMCWMVRSQVGDAVVVVRRRCAAFPARPTN